MAIGSLLEGHGGLRISDPRRTSIEVHAHLRELIISGVLPPGTELKQAELARVFAVSRTPLREAFRMLQEEGLIAGEPNQRSRVLGFDPEELELLYAGRVALECLGVRLTAGHLSREEERSATSAMREMSGRTGPTTPRAGRSPPPTAPPGDRPLRLGAAAHDGVLRGAERPLRPRLPTPPRRAFADRQRERAAILEAVRGPSPARGRAHGRAPLRDRAARDGGLRAGAARGRGARRGGSRGRPERHGPGVDLTGKCVHCWGTVQSIAVKGADP